MRKDEKLIHILEVFKKNVAQFISIGPDLGIKHYCIKKKTNEDSLRDMILTLIDCSMYKMVNIRSFKDSESKGLGFVYGKEAKDIDEILEIIESNSFEGLYSIINENIDVADGGVSGVIMGDVMEFSPEDTPRCVEKEGVCALPRKIGFRILNKVYGFYPDLSLYNTVSDTIGYNDRVEFSVHPFKQGAIDEHTIIWEHGESNTEYMFEGQIDFDNNFARYIGNKAFGLLLADALGFRVPLTNVIGRNVAPFIFGTDTGSHEKWIRTCPIKKISGKYFTGKGWQDPFKLMAEEEEGNEAFEIASVLSQSSVDAVYSGAYIIKKNKDKDIIESVKGSGDDFMLGAKVSENLPASIRKRLEVIGNQFRDYHEMLGELSVEWVYDGQYIWIVQLNQLKNSSSKEGIIVDGNPLEYIDFYIDNGLEALRNIIQYVKGKNIGINLIGNVGITSHFGDVLRINNIPSKITR